MHTPICQLNEIPPSPSPPSLSTQVGIGVISPASELAANPIENAIALMPLSEAAKEPVTLPKGAIRYALTLRGDESDEVPSLALNHH